MKKIITILSLAIILCSCSKDDKPTKVKPKLATFTQDDVTEYAVTYNELIPTSIEFSGINNTIINNPIVYNSLGKVTNISEESYLYNANNLINKVATSNDDLTCNLQYNGQNKLIRQTITKIEWDGQYQCQRDLTYSGNLLTTITESTSHYIYITSEQTQEDFKFDIRYDSSGNIKEISEFKKNASSSYILNAKTIYSYDNKPNPWKELLVDKIFDSEVFISELYTFQKKCTLTISNFPNFKIHYVSKNNLIKTNKEFTNGLVEIKEYQNTYNSANYITNTTTISTTNSQTPITVYNTYTYQ